MARASMAGGTTARLPVISATMSVIAIGAWEMAPNTATIPTSA